MVAYVNHQIDIVTTYRFGNFTFAFAGTKTWSLYIDNVRIYCNAYKSAARPAAYDKTYGQLVYFENFAPNNDFENLTNITIAPTMPALSSCAGYYAVGSGDVGDRVRTYGFEVGYADGDDSFRLLDESRSLLSRQSDILCGDLQQGFG